MRLKINIFDLSWCRFYLYDKRFDIGFPLADASLSMAIFVELFVVGLFIFPSVIGIYELPELSRLPFIIGGIVVCFSYFDIGTKMSATKDWLFMKNTKKSILGKH